MKLVAVEIKMMEDEEDYLRKFAVGSVPTLYYIPDYITDVEHNQLVNNVREAPISKWKCLKNRRLQNWGGVVHEKGLLGQDLPPWLTRITKRISEETRLYPSAINHVLINEYLPNQGIMVFHRSPGWSCLFSSGGNFISWITRNNGFHPSFNFDRERKHAIKSLIFNSTHAS